MKPELETTLSSTLFLAIGFICKAVMDTIRFKYDISIFRHFNERFWNPQESWRNKYKNGDVTKGERFPLSTTSLVLFTDAWHLFQFLMLTSFQCAIALPLTVLLWYPWYGVVILVITFKILGGLVFELFYKNIFISYDPKEVRK